MRSSIAVVGLAALVATGLPAVADAQHHQASTTMKFTVRLSGNVEQPAKGDPKGSGTAVITLKLASKTVCYSFNVKGIKLPAEAAHIHTGKAGKAGPVVVPLGAPHKNGRASGCVHSVRSALIKGMMHHPSSYYVNVHTSNYPGGAIRGQL